jgi:hypothetical protein
MDNTLIEQPLRAEEPTLYDKIEARLPVSAVELSLVLGGFLVVWLRCWQGLRGARWGTDELWYIHSGLNNVAAPHVLNRYFHIFLQKLFLELAPSPLTGVRIYWGFLVSLTAMMVYLSARILAEKNNIIHGMLAVGIFFSFRLLADYSGMTVVDITAMAMVAVFVFIYIYSVRFPAESRWAIPLLGFLFFLAFKSKETSVIAGLLVLGFGFDAVKGFSLGRLLGSGLRFLQGAAVGVVFFMVLNLLILKDPFFGLTPAHFMAFSNELRTTVGLNPEIQDWYSSYLLPVLPVAFLLYLISGIKRSSQFPPQVRLLWLVPLFLIVFLSFSMIKGDWGIRARHLFPVLPLFSMLAPQFLDFGFPAEKKEKLLLGLYMAGSLAFLVILRSVLIAAVGRISGDVTTFMVEILFPIAFSVLLALLMLKERYTIHSVALPLLCLALLLYAPLSSNVKNLFISSRVNRTFLERMQPLAAFENEIVFHPDMTMLVSQRVSLVLRNPNMNPDVMLSLFNFHFKASSQRSNFSFVMIDSDIDPAELMQGYDYILLNDWDWEYAAEEPTVFEYFQQYYHIAADPPGNYFLLTQKKNE